MNIIAIIFAALAAFAVGAIWYGLLFGKAWQRATGIPNDQLLGGNTAKIFGLAFLFELAMATMLSHNFERLGDPQMHIKLMISTGLALAFIIPALGVNYLFMRRSGALFFIDAGHWLLAMAAMGLVFALF